MAVSRSLAFASLLLIPLHAAVAQTGGAAPGANPSAGRANPGALGESLNNSNPNPSLNPNSQLPPAPGTNSAGTAQPSGGSNVGAGVTTGSAGSRAGGRVDGVDAQGPNKAGDPVRAEDATIDKKIKSICRGC